MINSRSLTFYKEDSGEGLYWIVLLFFVLDELNEVWKV